MHSAELCCDRVILEDNERRLSPSSLPLLLFLIQVMAGQKAAVQIK